jgi:NAD(P)-dependent dehydrogenase (short-subunit alcohol dehydrogenase family)
LTLQDWESATLQVAGADPTVDSTSQAALIMRKCVLAAELGAANIQVNAIA